MKENERIDSLGIGELKIIQNKEYFCFGIDSVLLANFVTSQRSRNVIVELCAGSGVISVIISAKKKYQKILSVELQKEMYELLERNISYNQLAEHIIPILGDIKEISTIRKALIEQTGNGVADIIVCNPPYKTKGTGCINPNDVKYIARHEVLCDLEDVFQTASSLLNHKGKLYLVHKPERLVDLLAIARKYHLEAKTLRMIQPTVHLKPSIVLVEYVKNGGNELVIEKPIIEYDEEGNYTEELKEIYGINTQETK